MARACASASSRVTLPSRRPNVPAEAPLEVASAWKPRPREEPCRPRVPGIRYDERAGARVQGVESLRFFRLAGHRISVMNDPCALSATELVDLYRKKELSPVEVATATQKRIEKLNPVLNAFNLVSPEIAAGAKASEARWMRGEPKGLLDGVPVSIKDIILTKGWPTLRGSKTVDPKGPWNDDAPVVARLREHGAVLLGKTTTPEFGWKGVTDSPLTGITRNPWNPAKTPGGSSGGAAAAVASGMGPLALGTDGGGSIRIPCSFTGLFGIKPSFGRVPAWPLSPFGTVAHVGPMTRTRRRRGADAERARATRRARLARAALRLARLAHRPRARRARPAHRLLARPRLRAGRSRGRARSCARR